ncbi:CpsB/CapC family capsule biosynthesis tyrosine phosphatase [Staphylococcus sp. HKU1]|uniref:tyrosine-protein phosphatase n=1 Tax=unclassified Staphylococcus TaxID=91994 RepID=UPI00203BC17D|nr:CpsB/CapC family capsule biosynthesis tyrosine phosphatase [Staphylococcus sp. Marseille-Q6910]
MIDIHNHILINVDDGPQSKEEAITLLKQASNEGVTDIIATPHHLTTRFNNDIHSVKNNINTLRELIKEAKININIYHGQEIRITDRIIEEIDTGSISGINDSQYLLIEFPSNDVPHYTQNLFYSLQNMGYIPIIAHPERNKVISQDLDVLFDLVNSGALAQLTSGSLTGQFGKKVTQNSIKMIENNLVHFIASDAHSTNERPFIMKALFDNKKLADYHGDLNEYLTNAKKLINNEKITKYRPIQDYKKKKWFGIF